jgi:signal transduction histidine kinase
VKLRRIREVVKSRQTMAEAGVALHRATGFDDPHEYRGITHSEAPLVAHSGGPTIGVIAGAAHGVTDPARGGRSAIGARRPEQREHSMKTIPARSELVGLPEVESVIAGLTHDVRAALGVVKLGANLARERLEQGNTNNAIELMSQFEATVSNVGDLCADLLECCHRRAGGGLHVASLTEIELVDAVRRCVSEHLALFESERCNVVLHVPESAFVRSHRRSIERVLANLLRNAAYYGRGKPIEIRVRSLPHGVLVVVQDHGPGIPGDNLRRLFAAFERREADDRHFERFGLGLWIVWNLVHSMGGGIDVATEAGRGTAVSFVLPTIRAKSGRAKESPAPDFRATTAPPRYDPMSESGIDVAE